MNISLPEALKSYVDQQVTELDYSSSSEFVRELIRKDKDRNQLRQLLLNGAASPLGKAVDTEYFGSLRERARRTSDP